MFRDSMAEQQPKPQLETSNDSIPSNQDLVESLLTDFTNQYVSNKDEDNKPNQQKEQIADCDTQSIASNESYNEINERDDNENKTENDGDIDEVELEKLEANYTEEQKNDNHKEAGQLKLNGNEMFKSEKFEECIKLYTQALKICPLVFRKDRAILYANRAAAKLKLDLKESAVTDCTKAIKLDGEYKKVYSRRAQIYKDLDKLDEALEDYKEIAKLDPSDKEVIIICNQLSIQISERNEKLKTEMLGQLKNLGNMILRPFGLSTNNFQMVQDPNSGGYSINFSQNTNN